MRSHLPHSAVLAAAFLGACATAPVGGGAYYPNTGGQQGTQQGSDTGGASQDAGSNGTNNPGPGTSGNTGNTGTATDTSSTGTKDTTSTGSGSTTAKCFGDFSLMSTPFSSSDPSQIGAKCDGNVPKNCPKGESIVFKDTGECICIIGCNQFAKPIPVGGNCNESGSWKCREIVSSNGNNKMKACVAESWGLCNTGGGATTGGGTTGTGTADAGSTGTKDTSTGGTTTCNKKKSGQACTFDSDCCSGNCMIGEDICE